MYFASFYTLLACVGWLSARNWFSQVARTFARDVAQPVSHGARFAHRAQAITARRGCSALGSALSFFPMFSPGVSSNYSFNATVQSLSRKPSAFARRVNSGVRLRTKAFARLK